jgi:hypothetical protein
LDRINTRLTILRQAGTHVNPGFDGVYADKKTLERARRDKRQGKAPSTQAGECVREEMEHIREGKHGARSTKQVIAIGLSKARRSGVKLSPPKKRTASRSALSRQDRTARRKR